MLPCPRCLHENPQNKRNSIHELTDGKKTCKLSRELGGTKLLPTLGVYHVQRRDGGGRREGAEAWGSFAELQCKSSREFFCLCCSETGRGMSPPCWILEREHWPDSPGMRVSSALVPYEGSFLKERSNTWARLDKVTSFQIERKEGREL